MNKQHDCKFRLMDGLGVGQTGITVNCDAISDNGIFFLYTDARLNNPIEALDVYDMDSFMQHMFVRAGEVCYYEIDTAGIHEKPFRLSSDSYSFNNQNSEISIEIPFLNKITYRIDLVSEDVLIEDLILCVEEALSNVYVVIQDTIDSQFVHFDYEHWG